MGKRVEELHTLRTPFKKHNIGRQIHQNYWDGVQGDAWKSSQGNNSSQRLGENEGVKGALFLVGSLLNSGPFCSFRNST